MLQNIFTNVNNKLKWVIGFSIAAIGGVILFWKKKPQLNQESEISENSEEFQEAAQIGRTLIGLSQGDQLFLYGLFKQATVGECKIKEPSRLYLQDHAKWVAWNTVKHFSKEEAEKQYIKAIHKYIEKGVECSQTSTQHSQFGLRVSTMKNAEHDTNEAFIEKMNKAEETVQLDQQKLDEKENDIFQQILNSLDDQEQLLELLEAHNDPKYLLCENEQQIKLIHLIVDGENMQALKIILPLYQQHNLVNIQESVSGMTALHYACLSGNKQIVEILVKYGADPKIKDFSGMDCFQTIDSENKEWLQQ